MEWKFLLGLGAITLVVIGLIVYFGLKLNKVVQRHAQEINLPLEITLSGNILFAGIVAFWVFCAGTRVLDPQSLFGAFLNTADGMASIFIGTIFFAAIVGAILERRGYPVAKRGDHS